MLMLKPVSEKLAIDLTRSYCNHLLMSLDSRCLLLIRAFLDNELERHAGVGGGIDIRPTYIGT